jgi:formamidopyrimidine-DNA glycosylase
VATPDADAFSARIAGLRFDHFGRRGKYLLLGLSDGSTLVVHLRMTGKLRLMPGDAPPDRHTHVVLALDDGRSLHYTDARKFGRLWLVDDPAVVVAKLGPEPLGDEFSAEGLAARLAHRTAPIKALLLDQRIVAGVGNIYADEALFRAGVHPARPAGSLTPDEVARLHAAVRAVLAEGIEHKGSSLGSSGVQNYRRPGGEPGGYQEVRRVYDRAGQPCLVCGTPIERMVLAQRSSHYCPICQKATGDC